MLKDLKLPKPTLGGIAVGSAVLFALVFGIITHPSPNEFVPYKAVSAACHYAEAKKAADDAKHRRDDPWLADRFRVDAINKADAAKEAQANAKECEDRARELSDLNAQWTAANAANNSAGIAWAVWLWSIIELLLLGLTLCAAYFALRETKKTTTEAEKAAKAANDSLTHAKDQGQKELRAYVLLDEELRIEVETRPNSDAPAGRPLRLRAFVYVKNFGQTPAHDLTVDARMEVRPHLAVDEFAPLTPVDNRPSQTVLGPGAKLRVEIAEAWIAHQDMQFVHVSRNVVHIWGNAHYSDVYGTGHATDFKLMAVSAGENALDNVQIIPLIATRDGNKAT